MIWKGVSSVRKIEAKEKETKTKTKCDLDSNCTGNTINLLDQSQEKSLLEEADKKPKRKLMQKAKELTNDDDKKNDDSDTTGAKLNEFEVIDMVNRA